MEAVLCTVERLGASWSVPTSCYLVITTDTDKCPGGMAEDGAWGVNQRFDFNESSK